MRVSGLVTGLVVVGATSLVAQQLEVEIVGSGVVSTEANETFPAEDPMTGALWFSVYERAFAAQTIMVAPRGPAGWSTPVPASFSGRWGDRAPRFSPDGSTIYFTSDRPRTEGAESGDMNIWQVRRAGSGWGEPELLASPFNSESADIHAAATPDALWLASSREGGRGRSDIYRVSWDGEVHHLSESINTELSQPDLWVNAEGTVMVLAITDHPDGYGGDDLYLSRFDGTSWSTPLNLGPAVNSAEYEYGPTASRDGQFLLFTSHKAGSADTYRVSLAALLSR